MNNTKIASVLIPVVGLLCFTPWVSSATALIAGVAIALAFGNPYADKMRKYTHNLLALAVVGLGFGMNLLVVGKVGMHGIGYTVVGIGVAFIVGTILGKILNIKRDTSLLITAGTAICGGSAIAAIAPVIKAKHDETSVALGTVFVLNAAALFIFPAIGHYLGLTEHQFGLWSALAIHDTSSVVGATLHYGPQAVEVGTTVKLARALWIIPLAALIGFVRSRQGKSEGPAGKAKRPWFILGFILAAGLVTFIPALQEPGHYIEAVAKKLMVLTLFFIGSSLTRQTVQAVGIKPFLQGVGLWVIMGSTTLAAIFWGIIS